MAVENYALTTVSRLADFLGLSSLTATETTVLESIINQVSSFVQNYTGKTFRKTAYTNELIDGYGSNQIITKNSPVFESETFTLEYRTSDLNEDEWETFDTESYFVDYPSGVIYRAGKAIFTKGHKRFRATYTAGYDFDLDTTFPSDIQDIAKIEMVIWQIGSLLWHRRTGDPGIEGERLGDYSITYSGSSIMGLIFSSGDQYSYLQAILDEFRDADSMLTTVVSPHAQIVTHGD